MRTYQFWAIYMVGTQRTHGHVTIKARTPRLAVRCGLRAVNRRYPNIAIRECGATLWLH